MKIFFDVLSVSIGFTVGAIISVKYFDVQFDTAFNTTSSLIIGYLYCKIKNK